MIKTVLPRSAFLAGVLGFTLMLAACGAEDSGTANPEGTGEAAAQVELPAAEGTVSYPMTLDSPFGSTTLTERPDRIAVISPSTVDTDALVALGVTPVMAADTVELEPWIPKETIEGVETFWTAEAGALPGAEEVLAAEPDLIVALQAPEGFGQADYDQLAAVAPVLVSDPAAPLSWEEITTELGQVLDLPAAAQQLTDDVQQQVDEIAERNPEFSGRTVAHVHVYGEQYGAAYFSYPGSDSAALLQRLGFALAPDAEKFSEQSNQISDELVGDIDADVLLLTVTPSPEGAGWFTDTPLFQAVPAVEDGRYAVYEPAPEEKFAAFAWAIRMQSPLSLPWAATTLEDLANEAIG